MDKLTIFASEFWTFGLKQASAALFGGALLLAILVTEFWYPLGGLHRFDALFLYAVLIQLILIVTRLEEPREVAVIVVFHLVATLMELFKTSDAIGSWGYPGVEGAVFSLWGVPLFAGFMYSAVGSYIARAWRLFDFRFTHMPSLWISAALAFGIYVNFFAHHFIWDFRYLLLVLLLLFFGRTVIYFRINEKHRHMPFMVGMGLVAFFIWIAENVSTFGTVWLYPVQQAGWQLVPFTKMVAWFLLLNVSFTLVALLYRREEKADFN